MDEDGDLKITTSGGIVLGPIGEDSSVSPPCLKEMEEGEEKT